ncbi:GtrA family protein [Pseudomonas zeae]|jgi:putative flippase GtrA|uniref:GtrA family protein n=1 Tax=Pseudomonas TaxID=286 RepID=UPI0008D6004D|nr:MULTISPECIES: GtrA family protein [Pseudomonas]UUT11188.1 GtrA family protein [Pseudomonas zeae]SEO62735.1 Putative flippase GtrA (transmembrane translocase of bactoprenol-linked glucose) [Pseudomonas sp. ok266]
MQALKYIFAGVANTAIGYGVFLLLVTFFDMNPSYANAIGYVIALIAAFVLNKTFVFNQSTTDRSTIPKFIVAFSISFAINQLVLLAGYRWLGIDAEIAQIFAMISYTIAFYLLNKKFVFNK